MSIINIFHRSIDPSFLFSEPLNRTLLLQHGQADFFSLFFLANIYLGERDILAALEEVQGITDLRDIVALNLNNLLSFRSTQGVEKILPDPRICPSFRL